MEQRRLKIETSRDATRHPTASLLDRVAVAIYSIDKEGICTHINATALELFGYAAEECLGRNMHALLHARRLDGSPYPMEDCPLYQARLRTTGSMHLEEVMWAKNGARVDVECSSIPVLRNGEPDGAVVTLADLRPRRTAEAALRNAEMEQQEMLRQRDAMARVEREFATAAAERQRDLSRTVERAAAEELRQQHELLTTVAETAPVSLALFDADFRIVWHNASFLRLLDTRRNGDASVGQILFDVLPFARRAEAVLQRVRETGETYTAAEFPIVSSERGLAYWRWSMSRMANGHLMFVAFDVSEQVKARREIEQIYQNAPIALALVDPKTLRVRRANQQQADTLGIALTDLIGKTIPEVFHVPEVLELFHAASQGHPVINQVATGELPAGSGQLRYWSLNLLPVMGENQEVEAISAAGMEMTTQRRAEMALVENDRLAAVGRLAASISHEINNPLEAVTNLLYLLQQDRHLSAESREYVSLASEELGRVSQIAAQTLRFHRQGKTPVSLSPERLVEPVVALYQGKLHHSKTKIERRHRDQKHIVCHEGEVRQVLNNLIGNALDAMPNGGRILVRTRSARHPKTGLLGIRITVADTGTGMSQQLTEKIFEPFYTTKGAAGSGLGLWISSTIAQKHGGNLRVRSSQHPGRSGTTFSFFLPQAS